MGKSKPKIRVVQYLMSIHYALCHGPVERLSKIIINDKEAWVGRLERQTAIEIDAEELFGGLKREGGVGGRVAWQPGNSTQLLDAHAATRHGRPNTDLPGYRGIATAYFTERPGASNKGFYWVANQPYVPPAHFSLTRIDRTWRPDIAAIPGNVDIKNAAITIAIDKSLSMNWGAVNNVAATPSRLDVARTATVQVLEALRDSPHAATLDIRLVAWSGTLGGVSAADAAIEITRRSCSSSDYADLIAFANGIATDGGGTNFTYAVEGLEAFFTGSGSKRRYFLFLTDGEPNDAGTADSAAATLSGLGSTNYAFNLILSQTTHTQKLDNTSADGVPVISALNSGSVVTAFLGAFSSRLDMNPAHIIREAITNRVWGLGLPPTLIDGAAFESAAETLFEERFGLSMIWTRQTTIESFVREIQDHIEAVVFVDPATGLYSLRLIRDDYDTETLPVFDPSNATISTFQRRSPSEITNEIVVSWTNPDNEEEEVVTVQDLGGIVANGGEIISDNRNYYGVRRRDLAAMLAARDIAASTAPLASAEVLVDRRAWALRPGDVVKLDWPEYGANRLVMRVLKVNYGRPGDSRIAVSLAEDIFSYSRPRLIPPPVTEAPSFSSAPETPDPVEFLTYNRYLLLGAAPDADAPDADEAFVGVLAATPVLDTESVEIYGDTTNAAGTVVLESLGTRDVTGRAQIGAALTFEVPSSSGLTFVNFTAGSGPEPGGFGLIGPDGLLEDEHEIVVFVEASGGTWTVLRGALDTVPRPWPEFTPIRFLSEASEIADETPRAIGVEIDYRVRTRTSAGILPRADAALVSYTPTERFHAPTRPAAVTVGGLAFGTLNATDPGITEITVTWANRNRLTEETVVLPWTGGSITPEVGQTTTITLLDDADDSVITAITGLTGTTHDVPRASFGSADRVRVRVTAERDGIESIQGHEVTVLLSGGYGLGYGTNYGG